MSDASFRTCGVCGEPEYACMCREPDDWTAEQWQGRCQVLADEVKRFGQMVKDAAQALNDEERENERLRALLVEALPDDAYLDDDWHQRVREALGE